MWVSVFTTPSTLEMPPAMTPAMSSKWRTRTIAIRSTPPATEYTSLTPSRLARASATSGMASVAQSMRTIAVITWALLGSGGSSGAVHANRAGAAVPDRVGEVLAGRDHPVRPHHGPGHRPGHPSPGPDHRGHDRPGDLRV